VAKPVAEIVGKNSGILKGNLDIHQISQVELNKTLWSGLKPAMAGNGMIIKIKYDEIYVASENNEEMIEDFLRINPGIKVVGWRYQAESNN